MARGITPILAAVSVAATALVQSTFASPAPPAAPAPAQATLPFGSSYFDDNGMVQPHQSANAAEASSFTSSSSSWWPSFLSRDPVPLLLWHGLGDSAYSDGIVDLKTQLEANIPGLFVHVIHLGDDASSDRNQGFFSNVNEDIELVCEQLKEVPELQKKKGTDGKVLVDALGFSQGGQFSRALAQRCPGIKVRNLVTFGSQHMGISDLPTCQPSDVLCRLAQGALKSGVYTDYAQNKVVTAQYFRNPLSYSAYERYLESNHFLTDINNELEINEQYKDKIASLENFVMLQFDQDVTVVPRRSGWFESYAIAEEDGDEETHRQHSKAKDPIETIPLRQSSIYKEDRMGLRKLDNKGGLVLDVCHGHHMQIDSECWAKVVGKYIGTSSSFLPSPVKAAWNTVLYQVVGIQSASALPGALQLYILLIGALLVRIVVSLSASLSRKITQKSSEGRIRLV